jgi:hypothetical protein
VTTYSTTASQMLIVDSRNVDSTIPANYIWIDEEELWNSYASNTLTVYKPVAKSPSPRPPPIIAHAAARPFHRPLYPRLHRLSCGCRGRRGIRRGRWRPWTGLQFSRRSRGKAHSRQRGWA